MSSLDFSQLIYVHSILCRSILQTNSVKSDPLAGVAAKVGTDVFDGISTYIVGYSTRESERIAQLITKNGGTK